MPRRRKREEEEPEEDEEDDDEEEEEGDEVSPRDFAMARGAGALVSAQGAVDALTEFLQHFVDTTDDAKGKERKALLAAADDALGLASRLVQLAQGALEDMDDDEIAFDETDEVTEADNAENDAS